MSDTHRHAGAIDPAALAGPAHAGEHDACGCGHDHHHHDHAHGHAHGHSHGHAGHAPFVRRTAKVGRNDPCPCGSGQKYKKCCIDG